MGIICDIQNISSKDFSFNNGNFVLCQLENCKLYFQLGIEFDKISAQIRNFLARNIKSVYYKYVRR